MRILMLIVAVEQIASQAIFGHDAGACQDGGGRKRT